MIDYDELDDEMIQFEKDHPRKKSVGGSGNSDALKKVVYALSAVAAILVIVLVIVLIRKNTLVKELNLDKENLASELIALQGDYEALSTTNAEINDSLLVEKEKVGQLIEKLQKTEATNRAKIRQYEKETGTLRSIMKSYIKQIDSLNTLNTNLRNEASAARRDAQESRRQYEDLRSTTDKLSAKASAGAVVKARGFNMVAINASNKQTERSSRTAKLKTCLSLIENLIADHGYRTIYIRIKGPDGVLLADSEENVFTCEGQQMIYSASREVDYQGEEVEICIYFANPQGFTKGVYTVDIYSSETKLGSTDLLLK
ncbi:MAG: hypothetical protein KBS72_07905 [Bacteroidales bacterium]|nr:hypothetical protein [Candidatus Cacconaster scatequi]